MILVILVLMSVCFSDAYQYAPHPQEVKGRQSLACLGIKYTNTKRYANQSQCRVLANGVSDFYSKASRGLLHINPAGYLVNVPYTGSAAHLNQAVKYAIKKHPGFDMYAAVGIFVDTDHAGNRVAYLQGTLQRDADHEVGHLEGLGHSGVYKYEDGKWTLDPYGDADSVMGRFPADGLTAPQYYAQGWIPLEEAAMYRPGENYTLKKISNFAGPGLSIVRIGNHFAFKQTDGDAPITPEAVVGVRDAYVAYPTSCDNDKGCVALYLASDGGSQRIQRIGNEYYDEHFTGLHIKVLERRDNQVTISIDYKTKP